MPRFERGGKHGNRDDCGEIRVEIRRMERGKAAKGNISRTFRVSDSKVSEVTEAIMNFLFGDDEKEEGE
jgi:hypothetical protein